MTLLQGASTLANTLLILEEIGRLIFPPDRDPVKATCRMHALRYVYRLPLIEEAHIHRVAELIRAA